MGSTGVPVVANEKLVIFDNGSKLILSAEGTSDQGEFKVDSLVIADNSGSVTLKQTLRLGTKLAVPRKLLRVAEADQLVFRNKDELETLAQEEWAALRERLRRRLAQPFEVTIDGTNAFFELKAIAGSALKARLWFAPEILDGPEAVEADQTVLRAEATTDLKLDVQLTAGAASTVQGRWRIELEIKKAAITDAISALLAIDIPALPALNLDWPRFTLPQLSFHGCSFPSLGPLPSFFATALPSFVTQLTFDPDDPLSNIHVRLTDGDATIATALGEKAGGTLKYGTKKVCEVSGYTFVLDTASNRYQLNAVLQLSDITVGPFALQIPQGGKPELPFNIAIAAMTTTIKFDEIEVGTTAGAKVPGAKLTNDIRGLKITAAEDPTLFITLDMVFETTLQNGGSVSTRLTELKIVEPYPLTLIANVAKEAVEAAGELIRLIAAIPLPKASLPGFDTDKLTRLLVLLARMLAAAMTWLAKRAGDAAGLLAGAVEAVAKLLGQLLDGLSDVAKDVFKVVCIEVRLDAQTYHIRQIVLTPANDQAITKTLNVSALGFDLVIDARMKPSLMIDLGAERWFGLVVEPDANAVTSLKTDLWLDKETGPQQPLGTLGENDGVSSKADQRLIVLQARPGKSSGGGVPAEKQRDIVVAAVQRGKLRLFQRFVTIGADRAKDVELETGGAKLKILSKHQSGRLESATIGTDEANNDIVLNCVVGDIKGRILGLLPKSDPNPSGNEFAKMLSQKIEILPDSTLELDTDDKRKVNLILKVKVHLGKDFEPQTDLKVGVDLDDLSMRVTGGDRIAIKGRGTRHHQPLGFDLEIKRKETVKSEEYEQFYLDLSAGGEKLGLGAEADALLSYDRVTSAGKGLQFELSEFAIGRSGIDLAARIKPDPVRLGGVDMPFTFTSGNIVIKGSRFSGGSLIGSGQLPKKLIGEAKASIALTLGRSPSSDDVVVEAATALIDKSGDPIKCQSTRFDITITELGFDFRREESYHFYFLVTGSARFNPDKSEFARGLLKNFSAVEIRFDKAPLTSDSRVLMRSISFLVKLKPPLVIRLFDIFKFELRSIAFYPASDKFDGDAAMGFGGQVNFLKSGDRVSIQVNFHEMLVGPPKSGESLPRIRFDGLSVAISLSGVKVGGTAITVDGDLPSLYRPNIFPKNISAHGFLASGTLEVQGWAPMSATLGFLELKNKDNPASELRHAFFFYGQMNKMSEPIDTPIGTIYLREVGFGFGYRYTLAGIAQAEQAKTPQELIKVLDEVSKYQGSLDRFEAWEPTYDNADLTLALRGMLALSAAQRTSSEYKEQVEARLPNPILLDIIAAIRTDLTILINLRAWLCVNYHKWATDGADEEWKRSPVFRGYLYFSAPKREFLGRFISNRSGYIGEHPPMPEQLKKAIQSSDFSATLYIRPGLFHFELGWPYELGFELGKRGEVFFLSVRGGLIHRVEDFSVLQGIAFKAYGEVHLEGRIGSDSFGAAAVAHATFDIEARILSYLSLRNFDESMYYGYLRIDILIDARVEVWLSFKVFGKRIRFSVGFSLQLAVSLAIEGVISPKGLGGRAHASVGIRAFGRTASVGIGFSFNDGLLNQARARVAGFMALGLTTSIPDKSQDGRRVEVNPPPETPRNEAAALADQVIDHDLGAMPAPEVEEMVFEGRTMSATNFWAMLYPTASSTTEVGDGEWYVMQLVPRDHTPYDENETFEKLKKYATFFASPKRIGKHYQDPWHVLRGSGRVPSGFEHLREDEQATPVEWNVDYQTNGGAAVSTDGVTLVEILGDLFLDDVGDSGNLTEPDPRDVEIVHAKLEDDSGASASTLARHGRSRVELPGKRKREAQIEEARSAILASVVESAARLAGQSPRVSPLLARHPEVDARDFGLTFLVSREALTALFPDVDLDGDVPNPPLGAFEVRKSDTNEWGSVHLFNPPGRMFRRAQPSFRPKHIITDQGIMLDWDLEPAWGPSVGAYHDPEFHLRHYRVRRTIRGLMLGEFRDEFTVKAAAPTKLVSEQEHCSVTMRRAPFQFIDDLRQAASDFGKQAIPEGLRHALLGNGDKQKLKDIGIENPKAALEKVNILYDIVPVDIAGTSDFGEPYEVRGFKFTDPLPVSPRQAILQLSYDGLDGSKPPTPLFMMTPRPGRTELALQLRILTERIEALGTYGNDALEQATRFDERSIERLKGTDVADFVIILKDPKEGVPTEFVFQNEDRELNKSEAVKKVQGESEESKNLKPFYFKGNVQKLEGGKLISSDLPVIMSALDASAIAGLGRRLFVRLLAAPPKDAGELARQATHGEWRSMPVNIVVARDEDARKRKYGPFSVVVDSFERPLNLAFKALSRAHDDANAESGRLHLVYPASDSTLDKLIANENVLPTLRDPARRTATKLTWKVAARHLACAGVKDDHPDLYRWVGGYDVHVVDPDAMPVAATSVDKQELIAAARPVGRVALLPPSFDGLEPSGFGDFSRLESAYPSETLRLLNPPKGARASGIRRAGWYSPAESTAIFPQPSIRRSLMPDPDEALIACLFAQGKPDALRVSIPGWTDKGTDPLTGWKLSIVGDFGGALGDYGAAPYADDDDASKIALYKAHEGFAVADVRQLLQNLRLVPDPSVTAPNGSLQADPQEADALSRRVIDPTYLSAITVRIEALRNRRKADGKPIDPAEPVVVAKREHAVDLVPPLHPVLADALAFLPYASQDGNKEEVEDGRIYRRYSIVPDANPEVKAKTFEDWLGEAPPERDAYGWGALRTLGLAQGLRVYDSLAGDYLRGTRLLTRVRAAMTRALMRYRDKNGQRFIGQPFVDLLTKPWGTAKLFWFDGGGESLDDNERREFVDNEPLAVVQMSLRPAPDRLVRGPQQFERKPVRYFQIVPKGTGKIRGRPEWRLRLAAPDAEPIARFDVLALSGGLDANPAVRLEKKTIHGFKVSGLVPQGDVIAVVRATSLGDDDITRGDVETLLMLEKVEKVEEVKDDGITEIVEEEDFDAAELMYPVVTAAGYDNSPDLAFGKFEQLKPQDWADALFRPAKDDVNKPYRLSTIPAFDVLAYYLSRRFGRITLLQGLPLADPDNPPNGLKESESATASRAEVAAGIVRFWTRFLDHCAPKSAWATEDTICFSIGTVADPGVWRRTPDASGNISIVIPDPERRGARRKYAIRPYGRYESWIKAMATADSVKAEEPPDLRDALDDEFAAQFLDVTLPRTEPLEKPVILSALRRKPRILVAKEGEEPEVDPHDVGRIEIVVAHGTDMVLAQANRRNEAMLAPLGISVGYLREFPHDAWLKGIVGVDPDFDPLAEFGSRTPDGNFAFPVLGEQQAKSQLQELRKLVPDAWLGSTLVSAASLPYFFRAHTLVHMSAGIVVSETTRAVFEEGFAETYFPFDPSRGYDRRSPSKIPTYQVTRSETGKPLIAFDLAVHRFVDCMRPREAVLWFGKSGEHWAKIRNVVHLPEPGISYRISIEASISGTSEVLSRAAEFDLLPAVPKDGERSRYLCQSTGQAFEADGRKPNEALTIEPTGQPGPDWRLRVVARLREDKAATQFSRVIAGGLLAELSARLDAIVNDGSYDGKPLAIDVTCAHEITCDWAPTEAEWQPLFDECLRALKSAPEAEPILRLWEKPPAQGTKLSLPLSYPARYRFDALQRLKDLCRSDPKPGVDELLLVRRLATDHELLQFKPTTNPPTPVATELWDLLRWIAADQLFRISQINSSSQVVEGDRLKHVSARLDEIINDAGYQGATLTIDLIRYAVVTCKWKPTAVEWAPLFDQAMKALKSAPEATEILRQWQTPPDEGATLTLPISYPARHKFDALVHLESLCKSKPEEGTDHLLLARPVPTDAELGTFKPRLGEPAVAKETWESLLRMAARQLFGPERRPAVSAIKGTLPPLHHPIAREIEGGHA
jgi:hypothetical protein